MWNLLVDPGLLHRVQFAVLGESFERGDLAFDSGRRRNTRPNRYTIDDLATWRFLDYAFANGFDQMSSLTKIRQAGWREVLDTEDTITQQLQRLRNDRIIP